ncbi:MAG: hypothetical protein U0P81_12060 [Holophagaceae bacterium]
MALRKLSLGKETLRALSAPDLAAAAGGRTGVFTECSPLLCWKTETGGGTLENACRTTVADCPPRTYTC